MGWCGVGGRMWGSHHCTAVRKCLLSSSLSFYFAYFLPMLWSTAIYVQIHLRWVRKTEWSSNSLQKYSKLYYHILVNIIHDITCNNFFTRNLINCDVLPATLNSQTARVHKRTQQPTFSMKTLNGKNFNYCSC